MPKETCPICVRKGDTSLKEVEVVTEKDREIREFSCGHRVVHAVITDVIRARDEVEVAHIKRSLKQEKRA